MKWSPVIWSLCPRSLNWPVSAIRSHMMTSVSLAPLASRTPELSKAKTVTAERWPLKLTIVVAILLSQSRMLPSSYPTANTSLSVLLCAIAVTWALHFSSRHRPSNSPFLTSQYKTSSLAATTAWPTPVPERSLEVHTMLEVLEVTRPNDLEYSNFLYDRELARHLVERNEAYKRAITSKT